MSESYNSSIKTAADAISAADALLITAGAGMGVDSGLPDFRGDEGFWNAYPPLKDLGISFVEMADPSWFQRDPELAWGFYGHRLNLYRSTIPHQGFEILRSWGEKMPGDVFIFSSNVDGHFQAAGFAESSILECHGSIHHFQCANNCSSNIWPDGEVKIEVNHTTFRASSPLPTCPQCGGLARPNILMFGDWGWLSNRTSDQSDRFDDWLNELRDHRLVIVELGAGMAVPTVRMTSERVAHSLGATLIRINPREPKVPRGHISISAPAQQSLLDIDAAL